MPELKPISKEAIPEALRKVERYRLLNEPALAQSICEDILAVEPGHQGALIWLTLSLADQFGAGVTLAQARAAVAKIEDEYERLYHTGILHERQGRLWLHDGHPGSAFSAYESLTEAMAWFEKAEAIRPPDNDDAILRWNTCVRILRRHPDLRPRPREDYVPALEE